METLDPQPLTLTEPPGIEWAWVDPPPRQADETAAQREAQYLPFLEGTAPSLSRVDARRSSPRKTENEGGALQWLKKFFDWLM